MSAVSPMEDSASPARTESASPARTRGTFHLVEARNPETVCCPSALLACALLTVGVPEHPAFPFAIQQEEISGQPVTIWRLSLIHISEPTRLLSISYAVFCLKKKSA